jgi:predicted dehydrogenase
MRVALIGCGAISESFHLPALRQLQGGSLELVLVDPDESRARALAEFNGTTRYARSHGEIEGRVDAAIIATPHHTHVPIARDLVEAGIPVLSEKPLGTTVAEVEEIAELSKARGVVVAVNQTRRFIPACIEIKRLLDEGAIGSVTELHAEEGDRFGWPAATPSMFGARSGGKGVLLDIGAHVFDLLVWWFGPDLVLEEYLDDSFGGSEAAAHARLRAGETTIHVRLSWLAKQPNQYRFQGLDAGLEWAVYDLDRVRRLEPGDPGGREVRLPGAPKEFAGLAPRVLEDFLAAVEQGHPPAVTPADVLPSMRLIEACYANRTRFEMPWQPLAGADLHVG